MSGRDGVSCCGRGGARQIIDFSLVRAQDFSRCAHLPAHLPAQIEDKAEAEDRATQAEDEVARLKAQLKATEESRRKERDKATVQVPMSRVLFPLLHRFVFY